MTSALLEKLFALTHLCSTVLPANPLEPESSSTKVKIQILSEPGCSCVRPYRCLSTAVPTETTLQVTHESCVALASHRMVSASSGISMLVLRLT